jgi:HEAT repeat protein
MSAFLENLLALPLALITPERMIDLMAKGTLILAAAGLLAALLRHASAAVRHWIWSLAFFSLLVLPALVLMLPEKHVHALPGIFGKAMVFENREARAATRDGLYEPSSNREQQNSVNGQTDIVSQFSMSSATDLESTRTNLNSSSMQQKFALTWPFWSVAIWLLGVLYFLLRILFEARGLRQLVCYGEEISAPKWKQSLRQVSAQLRLNRRVRLIKSARVAIPATFGLWRPVILFPANAEKWSPQLRETILLHELAHVKRGDYCINLIVQFVCALYWYNPLVWLAARRHRFEREQACDDVVLAQGAERCEYADHLLEIVRALPRRKSLEHGAIAMAQPNDLKKRLQHILAQHVNRRMLARISALSSGVMALFVIMPLAMLQLKCKTSAQSSERRVDVLIADLQSEESETQKRAAWGLGERENPAAVTALIATLNDDDAEVRAMAAWALGEIKDKRALEPLIAARRDQDAYAREMIVKAIGELEDPIAVTPLVETLQDTSADVRYATLWALGEIGNDRAFEAVISALNDSQTHVREMAASVLGEKKVAAAGEALLARLTDADPNVRIRATLALGEIGEPRAVQGLLAILADETAEVRKQAAWALGRIGDEQAVNALIRLLRDRDAGVRAMAVWALDEIKLN